MRCNRRALFGHTLLAAMGVLSIGGMSLADDYGSPRQYYGPWQPSANSTYYYRNYYYKPTPTYTGYKHHYVMAYPSDQKRLYYYNPYKKTYWGYCPTAYSEGEPAYSHLPAEYQKSSLSEIPESAFPPLGPQPAIPESQDGARLDLPPDDLPPGFASPRSGPIPPAPAPKAP